MKLPKHQQEFIRENASEMSVRSMAKHCKVKYHTIKNYLTSHGIVAARQRHEPKPKIKVSEDAINGIFNVSGRTNWLI